MSDPAEPKNLDAHLFICTNRRETGESCGASGGCELRDRVKKMAKDPALGWKGRVRVNAAGCLGHCEQGVVAVLYPEGRWFTDLQDGSESELIQAISQTLNGKAK